MSANVQTLRGKHADAHPSHPSALAHKKLSNPAPGVRLAYRKPSRWLTLRRGTKLMVVFRGCPDQSVVESLRRAKVMIGLALSPDELTRMDRLDSYSYVFVGPRSRAASAFAAAVSDLIHSNWSLADNETCSRVTNACRCVSVETLFLAPESSVGSTIARSRCHP